MSIELTAIEKLYIKRRLNNKMLVPVRSLATDLFPQGRGFVVTTLWNETGANWSLGRHTGEDYQCPEGMPVFALTWGKVLWAGTYGGWSSSGTYGNHVIIRDGTKTYDYATCHMSLVLVPPGLNVRPGTLLGFSGRTGNVTGAHVHLEARPIDGKYGQDVDPKLVRRKAKLFDS